MAEKKPPMRALEGGRTSVEGQSSAPRSRKLDTAAIECLTNLVREFGSTLELDRVLKNVADGIKQHVDYDTFAVLLLDTLGEQLHFDFAVGYSEEVQNNWSFGLGQGIVGTVAQTQKTLRVGDVKVDPRYISAAPGVRSELAIPLVVKKRTIGVMPTPTISLPLAA